jgi:hypothetical protein
MAKVIRATECSQKTSPSILPACRKIKKDVNLEGTNRRSPLESTKVSKKQTQNKLKQSQNKLEKRAANRQKSQDKVKK